MDLLGEGVPMRPTVTSSRFAWTSTPVEVIHGAHESDKKKQKAFDQLHNMGRSGD